MRRLLLLITMTLALIAVLNSPPASRAMIPCDQANAACGAMADDDMLSCVIVHGQNITAEQFKACVDHAAHIYAGCMEAHGCPIITEE